MLQDEKEKNEATSEQNEVSVEQNKNNVEKKEDIGEKSQNETFLGKKKKISLIFYFLQNQPF